MADISLVQDNCLEESDEGVYEQGDGHSVGDVGDDTLSPLQRIKKYAEAENIYDRQMVSRVLLELFKLGSVDGLTTDLNQIMDIVVKLADEDDPMVRTYLLEQIPNLASLATECSTRVPALANVISEHMLPLVVRNLGTSENQVRKAAHTTLFELMEQRLVSKAQAEIQVCPTVLALSRKECYYHTDAVTLMSKMVPLLGKDVVERVFLDRFSELCLNDMFYVRKVCASHFGEFCAVVGKQSYEKVLLPAYVKLCKDEIWGVRKACADVAMPVSCVCAPLVRRTVLAPAFEKLLQDDCRWVRISAFQTLGPFISTFADPSITSLAYNNMGELVLVNADGSEFKANSSTLPTGEVKNLFYLCLNDFNNIVVDVDDGYNDIDRKNKLADGCVLEIGDEEKKESAEIDLNNLPTEDTEYDLDYFLALNEKMLPPPDPEVIHEDPLKPQDKPKEEDSDNVFVISKRGRETMDLLCNLMFDVKSDQSKQHNKELLQDHVVNSSSSEELHSVDLSKASEDARVPESQSKNHPERSPSEPKSNNHCDKEKSSSEDMPLDPSIVDAGNSPKKTLNNETVEHAIIQMEALNFEDRNLNEIVEPNRTYASVVGGNGEVSSKEEEIPVLAEPQEPPQHIVPQLLIDHFISMTDPNIALNTDDNIAYHCAYSLPAVALTLGCNNWHLLKDTVETLAANMQYKVRRTLASSLHELALILGPDMASNNLTPIFNGFIKDLDEVRIGVLKHLAHFLRLISPAKRAFYLPRLSYFLQNNHELNWRFRYELAEQLLLAVSLFPPADASKHITYIAQKLLCDKVSAVRQVALRLVAELLRHISGEPGLSARLLVNFAEKFAHSKMWKFRQTFVLLGAQLLASEALQSEQFASEVMPHLLDLSWDPVANVRLVVAATITKHMIYDEYFSDPENLHYDSIDSVLRRLQTDKDRDVRQSAGVTDDVTTLEKQPQSLSRLF